jgi:hypothetical protein
MPPATDLGAVARGSTRGRSSHHIDIFRPPPAGLDGSGRCLANQRIPVVKPS